MKTSEYSRAAIRNELPEYFRQIEARLKKSADEYGDQSFYYSPKRLIEEMQEETADIPGWGFILRDSLKRDNAPEWMQAEIINIIAQSFAIYYRLEYLKTVISSKSSK